MIATSSDDGTIRLWDPDTGKEIHVFNEPKGYACHLDWHPSGRCIGKNLKKVLSGSSLIEICIQIYLIDHLSLQDNHFKLSNNSTRCRNN